jgi:tetratricopeptide (TPR) repeat protein
MPCPSTRSRRERGGAAALVLISLLAAATAAAAPESEAVRQSREHYRKGEEAYAAGHYDDAYREFERGYALAPRPVYLLNLAHTERRRGNLASARGLYQKFLLIEPASKYAAEVKLVILEIDSALAAGAPPPEVVAPPPPPALALAPSPVPQAAVSASPLPPVRPLYRRWWVWASAGAVVAAGVATVLFLGRSSYQQEGSLGTIGTR